MASAEMGEAAHRVFCPIGNRVLYAEHWRSAGRAPTVVIEPGSLMPGTQDAGWQPIRDVLTADWPVVLYDRAGLGQSAPAPEPRPLSAFSVDLRAVLDGAGAPPPYLLVGGSFGGMLVLHFASRLPAEIAGVLLVDSTHPAHNQRALAALPPEAGDEPAALRAFRTELSLPDRLPPGTDDWERLDVPASLTEAAAWNLRDIPLIVLTAGQDEWEPDFPAEAAQRYAQVWLDLQCEMAALSTRGQQRLVADSDHLIHLRRPDLVLAAIHDLARQFSR